MAWWPLAHNNIQSGTSLPTSENPWQSVIVCHHLSSLFDNYRQCLSATKGKKRLRATEDWLDLSCDDFVGEPCGVSDDKISLVPCWVVADIFSDQMRNVIQFSIPEAELWQYPLPTRGNKKPTPTTAYMVQQKYTTIDQQHSTTGRPSAYTAEGNRKHCFNPLSTTYNLVN